MPSYSYQPKARVHPLLRAMAQLDSHAFSIGPDLERWVKRKSEDLTGTMVLCIVNKDTVKNKNPGAKVIKLCYRRRPETSQVLDVPEHSICDDTKDE